MNKSKHFTSAIILCAGSGDRMQGTDKQLTALLGTPIAIRSTMAFEKCDNIDEIILVTRQEQISVFEELVKSYKLSKVTKVVCGGSTRQQSALCGVQAVWQGCKFIAIHDGARCLITPKQISCVTEQAYKHNAATAATRCSDTVKLATKADFTQTSGHPDRSKLWLAQTPQAFKLTLYQGAVHTGKDVAVTDDCAIIESAGFYVKLVDCGRSNMKITTKEDLVIAQAILSTREEQHD